MPPRKAASRAPPSRSAAKSSTVQDKPKAPTSASTTRNAKAQPPKANHEPQNTSVSNAKSTKNAKKAGGTQNQEQEAKRKRINGASLSAEDGIPGPLPRKRAKTSQAPVTSKAKAEVTDAQSTVKVGKVVNNIPSEPLDIFVFGDGSCAQLGLGSRTTEDGVSPTEALRPRLNKLLSSENTTGVVQIACGGMNAVALTKDHRILTWVVNDLGALGRNTKVEEDEDDELNPAESTPGPVDMTLLGAGIVWTQVVASDNASFALAQDGR
ncbi:regulator of chromosome condensation 1/beta-lactamase-inhibitor protein II [Apiospora phragmitis]|uniref:Regulator of chromosome condensation 1/beta-lactamase-inhibitor protein II n=1 Tax=Apiospora phragmitis TaxID=2905665 RepID=A0ABR1T9E1_9PEZI